MLSYFKNLFHSDANRERKRRHIESTHEPAQLPKYRRISNNFPIKYNSRADDDTDYFRLVTQKRNHYNELLLDNMDRQQRVSSTAEEEFSDEDDVNDLRFASSNTRRLKIFRNKESKNFQLNQQSSSSSQPFRFDPQTQSFRGNERKFPSNGSGASSNQRNLMPDLVPISTAINFRNDQQRSGFAVESDSKPKRRSIIDFKSQNRACCVSPKYGITNSVIQREQNNAVRSKYEALIRTMIPSFAQKATQKKYSNGFEPKPREQIIPIVDLSSDETEISANGAASFVPSRYPSRYPSSRFNTDRVVFKKPSAFVELSDDESVNFELSSPIFSSTIRKSKDAQAYATKESDKSSESSRSAVPEVAPVNTLKERNQTRNCLQEDVLTTIAKKFFEFHKSHDQKILDAQKSISELSCETANLERQQQRRIDEAVTTLKQCVIIDEEEDLVEEYPALTDHQLKMVRHGLYGPPHEVLVNKFSMSITRKDLNTLDGLNWLNDEVINFYMELLKQRSIEVDYLPKVHVMNTFFVGKLLQQGHAGVRRWTRKIDVFSYDVIPVPVHVGNVHWCMSIIHIRDKTIKYYDSMGHENWAVIDALEQYLRDESMDKLKVALDTSDWTKECVRDCPKQHNGSDCGVFSCMFAEFVCRDSKISFDQQHMPYFRRKMVYEIMSGKLLLGY